MVIRNAPPPKGGGVPGDVPGRESPLTDFYFILYFYRTVKMATSVKEAQVRAAFLRRFRDLLPSLELARAGAGALPRGNRTAEGPDLILDVRAGGRARRLVVEAKSVGEPRYLAQAIGQLQAFRKALGNAYPVVVAPYISPEGQRLCREAGIGYVDLAGNAYLRFDGILVERTGRRAPREARVRLRRLFSPRSTRVLRVFLENPKVEWTLAQLGAAAQVSLRTAHLVVNALADKAFVEKRRGSIRLAKGGDLLDLWVENYSFDLNQRSAFYSFIREPRKLMQRIALTAGRAGVDYAFTLHSGASLVAPFVRFTDVHLYIGGSPAPLVEALDLRPVESGGTVYLMGPYDQGVFYRTRKVQGMRVVGNVQLYLDLVKYPARGKEQADVLRKRVLKL